MGRGPESDKSFTETLGRVVRDGVFIGALVLGGAVAVGALLDPLNAIDPLL